MSAGPVDIRTGPAGIVYNGRFENMLQEHGLLDFDRVMSLQDVEFVKRAVSERSTARFFLRHRGEPHTLYVKRHVHRSCMQALYRLLSSDRRKDGVDEFLSVCAFHDSGLPTMVPVAAGVRRCGLAGKESFLLTLELAGCRRLDHLVAGPGDLPPEALRRIIRRTAQLVHRMHACGFNHRDLYLCHILRGEGDALFIVDLHRVDRRGRVPVRWKVKDIAALNYSALRAGISRTDRLRFLKHYLGVHRLSAAGRRFANSVLKKTAKMIQHNTKNRAAPAAEHGKRASCEKNF